MKSSLFCTLGLLLTASAFAYPQGSFTCSNPEGIPSDTYRIENVSMGGGELPFVEIHRFTKGPEGQPPRESVIKGLATVSTLETNNGHAEYLSLASLILQFGRDGHLNGCR